MKTWKKSLLVAAVGTAIAAGMSSQAVASPLFTVDPNALPSLDQLSSITTFNADAISGTSSELLQLNPVDNTASGTGWVQFTAFTLGSSSVAPTITGLNIDYQLYLTFTLKDTLASGTLGQVGSTYTLTQLDINVWYDPQNDSDFNSASAAGTGTQATVDANGADILLGTSSLVSGTAGLNEGGGGTSIGAFLNSLQTFSLANPNGPLFFISPDPFYEFAFTGFNNSGGGVTLNEPLGLVAINNAVGVTDFYRVPEPGSLALLGLALAGLGGVVRRRNQPV